MAMGTRQKRERQEELWVVSSEVVSSPAHAFYDRLNQILDQHHFDQKVERLCTRCFTVEITAVSTSAAVHLCQESAVGVRVDGFAGVPRNESALRRTVNALISRTLPFLPRTVRAGS